MTVSRVGKSLWLALLLSAGTAMADPIGFVQTNLVSNQPGVAQNTDPQLVNAWGISFGPTTPVWVSDAGSGVSTLYNGAGVKQGLVVTIPPPPGSQPGTPSSPTGTVFNGNSANFSGDRFLFATEGGTIAGWQSGTTAATRVDNSVQGAIYKGLAIDSNRIFATDFGNGRIDVFSSTYAPLSLGASAFLDPNLPNGYAPFGIQGIGGTIFVTYANKTPGAEDENQGAGLGYVDAYDANGTLLRHVVSGGLLNAPWGIALAPAGFGDFGGKLLVGNFGDGRIHAYDPISGAFAGTMLDPQGNPITIDGLWGLAFGSNGNGFSPNRLYFAAGPNDETDGLFGSLEPVPEPSSLVLLASACPWVIGRVRKRASARGRRQG